MCRRSGGKALEKSSTERSDERGVIYIQFIGTVLFLAMFGFFGLEFANHNRHSGFGEQIAREMGLIAARLCADEVAYERSLTQNLDPRIIRPGSPLWRTHALSPRIVSCLDQARWLVLAHTRGRGEFTNNIDAAINLFVPRSRGSTEFTRCFHYPDANNGQLVGMADGDCDHTNSDHIILSSREAGFVSTDAGNTPQQNFISAYESSELESPTAEWISQNLGTNTSGGGGAFTVPFVIVVEVSIERPGLQDLDPTGFIDSTIFSRVII